MLYFMSTKSTCYSCTHMMFFPDWHDWGYMQQNQRYRLLHSTHFSCCQTLPTLPTVQPNCWHFSQWTERAVLVAASAASTLNQRQTCSKTIFIYHHICSLMDEICCPLVMTSSFNKKYHFNLAHTWPVFVNPSAQFHRFWRRQTRLHSQFVAYTNRHRASVRQSQQMIEEARLS